MIAKKTILALYMLVLTSLYSSLALADFQSHHLKYRIEYYVAKVSFIEKYLPFLGSGNVPLSGKIDEVLRKGDDGTWLLERSGLIYGFQAKEISQFRLVGSTIEPIWYLRNQTGIFKDNHAEVKFPKGNDNVFDPITLALRIALDLKKEPTRTNFSYTVIENEGLEKKTQNYAVTGKETIKTPVGNIPTIVVSRQGTSSEGREYIFWLAPELEYMIARAQTFSNGDKKIEITVKGGRIGQREL